MNQKEWQTLKTKVVEWSKVHASNDYYYGAPYSWWREAKAAHIITDEEFEIAKVHYGDLWHYRGD